MNVIGELIHEHLINFFLDALISFVFPFVGVEFYESILDFLVNWDIAVEVSEERNESVKLVRLIEVLVKA